VGFYNVATAGIIGGVWAAFNKDRDESFVKVFWKGFGHWAVGRGYLIFESKRLIKEFFWNRGLLYCMAIKIDSLSRGLNC